MGNTIQDSDYGLVFWQSTNNTIYRNLFEDNQIQAFDGVLTGSSPYSTNVWDNGKIGTYWSDYQSKYPNAAEINKSGIGNMPYAIDAKNQDRYPIINLNALLTSAQNPTQTSTPAPIASIPELTPLAILPLLASVLLAAIVLGHRKTTN